MSRTTRHALIVGLAARFVGWQQRPDGRVPLELWTLLTDIPGHPAGSTVTRQTLLAAGLWVPLLPLP